MKFPYVESGVEYFDICPFTVFGSFNKNITNENRKQILRKYKAKFNIESKLPEDFDGIPLLNNMSAWFFAYKENREEHDIDRLWDLFESAIRYADTNSVESKNDFIKLFNRVMQQKQVKWNLTMGLFWIRPGAYLNLDQRTRSYLTSIESPYREDLGKSYQLQSPPNAEEYLKLITICKSLFLRGSFPQHSFQELSWTAWTTSTEELEIVNTKSVDIELSHKKYWLYAPGHQSSEWDEFSQKGIFGIGWDEIGDIKKYTTKSQIAEELRLQNDEQRSYKNGALALWQFANEIQIGDVVYVKKGLFQLLARGVVEGEYVYDSSRERYKHIRAIHWTKTGLFKHPGQASMKTLTEITSYLEYVKKLENIFYKEDMIMEDADEYESYSQLDFLSEVFVEEDKYQRIVSLLNSKKNIILQGPPGVGKTYSAKRLAYSIMGEKDPNRVQIIQFHQSYSYEDFMMGYRPNKDGFELKNGPFYDFCVKAAMDDKERGYFFIIDEINRGNLSKIFGELLMLIEKDKRGDSIKLMYRDELFSVPENVYLIGLMNTADRSLAMIDYALRRRFAFINMDPAYDSKGFEGIMKKADNVKFSRLIDSVKLLNKEIYMDENLGAGFLIGHSYFCYAGTVTNEWMTSVVQHEIIPLIQEYWFDDRAKVELWSSKLLGAIRD